MSPSSWQAHSHLLLPWQWRHPASFVSAGRREVFFFCFALHNKCNAVDKGYCTTSALSSSQYLIDSNRLRSLSLKCLLTLQLGTWHTEINQFSKDTEEFLWHSQMLKVCFRLMFDYYIETNYYSPWSHGDFAYIRTSKWLWELIRSCQHASASSEGLRLLPPLCLSAENHYGYGC